MFNNVQDIYDRLESIEKLLFKPGTGGSHKFDYYRLTDEGFTVVYTRDPLGSAEPDDTLEYSIPEEYMSLNEHEIWQLENIKREAHFEALRERMENIRRINEETSREFRRKQYEKLKKEFEDGV